MKLSTQPEEQEDNPAPVAELLPVGSTDGALAKPLDVVPGHLTVYVTALVERAKALKVTDQASFAEAAEALNNATKARTSLNARRLELARAYDQERDRNVNAVAKPWLASLENTEAHLRATMAAYSAEVERQRKLAEAEQEAERAKARALAAEAEARKEQAAKAVEGAQDEAAFNAAAEAFDKGMAAELEANALLVSASAAPLPELPKAKGVKPKTVVTELVVTDLAALPLAYHLADEAKLKRHILDGTLNENTPGLRFKTGTTYTGSGR